MRSIVPTRSITLSNDATRFAPVLSAHATRYVPAKSSRSKSYTSSARNNSARSTLTTDRIATKRTHSGRYLVARCLVERLQDIHRLRDDEIRDVQLVCRRSGGER